MRVRDILPSIVVVALLALTAQAGDYDRFEYRTKLDAPRNYSQKTPVDKQVAAGNARIAFIQPPKQMAMSPTQRYDMWKAAEPIRVVAPPVKPPSFLSFVGRSLSQIPAKIGRAIVSAFNKIVAVFKGPDKIIAAPPKPTVGAMVNQRTVAVVTQTKPTNIFTPKIDKPMVNVTPVTNTRPQHNITVPEVQQTGPKNINVAVQPGPTFHTKGPGLIDKARQRFGLPYHIPTNKLYPEPGGDFYRRPGFDENAVGRRKSEMGRGKIEPLSVIKTQQGYMISDGLHRWEAAQRANRPTVPAYIIGREK